MTKKKKPTREEHLKYMKTDTSSILGKLGSFPVRRLHQERDYSTSPRTSLRYISSTIERSRPSFDKARTTGFDYNPGYVIPSDIELNTGFSDERELQLENDFAEPISSESIEGGTNRPDLLEQEIEEAISKDTKLATKFSFNTFSDDFLIINDVFLYNVPTASISIRSQTDVFVGETLRTRAPVISTEGRQDFILNLSLVFNPGREQTEDLRRLISELSRHPLVFIFNNKVRKSIGVGEFDTTMFILEAGTLRSSSESVGAVVLDLQMHYFNHKPFSNNFFFNAKMPGISYSSEIEDSKAREPLSLDSLEGYESSDYILDQKAQDIRERIRKSVTQVADSKTRNIPVNFPSESDSWKYYADHLTDLTPIISEKPSDYMSFSVKVFEVKDPPKEAKQGLGTIQGALTSTVTRPSVKSMYDATKPLPESKTYQQKEVEATYDSNVQPSALEGTPIDFYSYDSGRSDSIILTASPGVVHSDASSRLSDLINVGKDEGAPAIQPGLILHMQKVANRFPGRKILVNSGSRFPKNPEKFYSKPVERRSRHATGNAMDFKVQGVSNRELFKFLRTLPNCGSGYYPNSTFCHADYRSRKDYWVDISGPGEKSHYLRGQDRADYLRQHVYDGSAQSDNVEAEADKRSRQAKSKPHEQRKDAAAPKSSEYAKQEEELYKKQTKQDPSIGHKVNDPVKRSWQARADWIEKLYREGGWIYYSGEDNKIRNVFYKEYSVEISSGIDSNRDPDILRNIVCSAISIQFGHRIAPMRLLSQHTYTYQFLGAGNKSGQMVFTFSGKKGRESADALKRLIIFARDNARNFGGVIKEAGTIYINGLNYNNGDTNTILSLLNIENIIITDIKESSLPDSVDKHQLVLEFIIQDFQEETFEKLFVESVENRRRIIKQIFKYLTRNKYGVVPVPSVATYDPSQYRPYVLNKETPSWVSSIISRAATITRNIEKQMPPLDWKLEPRSSRTWRDIYAEWGADKVIKGDYSNVSSSDFNASSLTVGRSVSLSAVQDLTERRKFESNGGSETNNTHNDLYREWLSQMTNLTKEVKKYIEDEKNFEKYFGSLGDDLLDAVTQTMGECYGDMLLPNLPHANIPVPPEFYVYDDSDESPILSNITDPANMEKFLKEHIRNEVQSISLYMRERWLGGSYLAKNLPRILENRKYYDRQMQGEFDFIDNFWKIYQEGATAWEPITYKEDPSIDNNSQVKKWKEFTYAGIGATNPEDARFKYMESLVGLSQYLNKGRHWQTSYTEQDNRNLVTNIYGDLYDKTSFGPNPQYNKADAASNGKALPERTLTQIQAITNQAYSKVAKDNNVAIPIGSDRTALPNGDIVIGDTKEERLAEEYSTSVAMINAAKESVDRMKRRSQNSLLGYIGSVGGLALVSMLDFTDTYDVDASDLIYRGNADAVNRASAAQHISNVIKTLDHNIKENVDETNQEDKMASMFAGMAIGSKADDLSIRRAYPTFKIYFIEEDAQDSEMIDGKVVRAFDDFYSYSAIQEIKITRSRKIASDLAVIRMTNVGGLLLRRRFGDRDPRQNSTGEMQGVFADTAKEHPFEKMVLQDGVKVQIRLGYASDPSNLESVFLGQIVEIAPSEHGKILEIMCQGYGAELESIELGELEDGPIYTSTQQALSSAIIQDSVSTFGRQSNFNRFNPAEIRHAWTGGTGDSILGKINPATAVRDWADHNMDKHFQKYTFLNFPQDDNIFAPPPSAYASAWMRFYNNACIYRPLKQTPWQIFKEHELRHPGYISMAVPYGHSPRMTMFFGSKMQHYWSKPPSSLELFASENAYNALVRMRGKVASGDFKSLQGLISRLTKESGEKPKLISAMLRDIALSGAPTRTSQAIAKETGRYKPFRNYHYFDSYHHILKNEIRTSTDGTFNEVEILFFTDEDDIQEQYAEDLIKSIQSLGSKQEGVFSVKLDENILESSLRSYREEFPSCVTVDMARRYAQGIFARHLRDAYKGELIVLGKETLKPYDICYLNDASINMTGPIEVEAVTHVFNRDNGFISIITPDLCVDVNDMFSTTVFDVAAAGYSSVWSWNDALNPPAAILSSIAGFLAMSAGVKLSMWTQDGDPVVPTPLTLGGKPFMSVSLGPNQSSLFLNFYGKWVQYWDDLEDAWHKFDIAEEIFDKRVGFRTKILSMLGTGTGE